MELQDHPCFNQQVCLKNGRVHLPVAPRCNIQCHYCSRKFDCSNDMQPGLTSQVLDPGMALSFLRQVKRQRKDISVVGIAGPGDPFANPDETIETFSLVRAVYPDILLCVTTNGLSILPYITTLKKLNVTHVTVTVNAVDPKIGALIYAWVRSDKRIYYGKEGAKILFDNQVQAIEKLKRSGMMVKVNTIVIPGINDDHIETIAQLMGKLKVDLHNCIPFHPEEGSTFAKLKEPDAEKMLQIRLAASQHLPQMNYCARCSSDAVGLLHEKSNVHVNRLTDEKPSPASEPVSLLAARPYLAVSSREGLLINQHLGEAENIYIYQPQPNGAVDLVSIRPAPTRGKGNLRWQQLADIMSDCHTLLVKSIAPTPRHVLEKTGLRVLTVEGLISDILSAFSKGQNVQPPIKPQVLAYDPKY